MFKDELSKLQNQIKGLMKKDTPDEQLAVYGELLKGCDAIEQEHKKLEEEQLEYREKYIESIKNYGTGKAPEEQNPTPKSLEEIASEVIKNQAK